MLGWHKEEKVKTDTVSLSEQQLARHKELISELSMKIKEQEKELANIHKDKHSMLAEISDLKSKAASILSSAQHEAADILQKAKDEAEKTKTSLDHIQAGLDRTSESLISRGALLEKKEKALNESADALGKKASDLALKEAGVQAAQKAVSDAAARQVEGAQGLHKLANDIMLQRKAHQDDILKLNEREIQVRNLENSVNLARTELSTRENALLDERSRIKAQLDEANQSLSAAKSKEAAVEAQKIEINKKIIEAQRATDTANEQIRKAQNDMASVEEHKQALLVLIDQYNQKTGSVK